MKDNQQNILNYVKNYNAGKYDSPDVTVQIEAGWYDWFCKDESLYRKTKKLTNKLKKILGSTKINYIDNYVFFKNNCPGDGSLYDDFRICDMKTGDVIYTITPRSGFNNKKGLAEVWGKENKFEKALVSGTWKDVVTFFMGK